MRILVMLLLDTLPMLGNVLLLCFFVFFIFGIIGVQLWAGLLRQRCYINETYQRSLMSREGYRDLPNLYYKLEEDDLMPDYICSIPQSFGMHKCDNLPNYKMDGKVSKPYCTVCNAFVEQSLIWTKIQSFVKVCLTKTSDNFSLNGNNFSICKI